MEKDQLDSLATVAVGSEKIPPPPHSHYAPSEIYSSSESPPAYSRPPMKSTAVQIARIIAMTLIAISVIIGSFILAGAWLQARASCTPESIAAMQAQMGFQQQHQSGEFFKRLQPEALIQDPIETKENLQILNELPTSNIQSSSSPASSLDIKDKKIQRDDKDKFKDDNESDNDNENEDDYDDSEFPPVHIKLPLQLDLDDLAGTLMQQARSLVSCVVERRRSDEFSNNAENQVDNNNNNNNNTDRPQIPRLSGERVTILCRSGDPRRQEQQDQDNLTPIIVPLGPISMPIQQHEQDYHRYQIQNQYPIADMMRLAFPNREMNQIDNRLTHEIRNIPQIMDMVSGRVGSQINQINQQQQEIRPVPFEVRPVPVEVIRGMRPPLDQEQQQPPMMFGQEQAGNNYQQDQQTQGMVPPPPPSPHPSLMIPEAPQNEARIIPQIVIRQQVDQRPIQSQENEEKTPFPLPSIPFEIRRIIQQVPLEIKNIIRHITGEMRPAEVPEGARREEVQDFKPFPNGNARPIPMASFLPIEVRNLLEHGNIEGRRQNDYDDQTEQVKIYPSGQDQAEKGDDNDNDGDDDEDDEQKRIPIPAGIRNIIHQVVEGRAFAVPRFEMAAGSIGSMEVPVEASARVTENNPIPEDREHLHEPQQQQPLHQPQMEQMQQQQPLHQQQTEQSQTNQEAQSPLIAQATHDHVMIQQNTQEEANRPHYVQPRSVRSIPDALVHPREKRTRRCACDCAC